MLPRYGNHVTPVPGFRDTVFGDRSVPLRQRRGYDRSGDSMGDTTNPLQLDTEGRVALTGWWEALLDVLQNEGYNTVGPVLRDGVVTYASVRPDDRGTAGVEVVTEAGHYRAKVAGRRERFRFGPGSTAWKAYLYPARIAVARGRAAPGGDMRWTAEGDDPRPVALLGIRACDLAAIGILDRAVGSDPVYRQRRARSFLGVAQCTTAVATCFCAAMGTGPAATGGFDLAWTELESGEAVIRAGSSAGSRVLAALPTRAAGSEDLAAEAALLAATVRSLTRHVEREGVADRVKAAIDGPVWDRIAARCLGCGNCTAVCPTCFCTAVEDRPNLTLTEVVRERYWDTCFSTTYSYIHGGAVRQSLAARYRQWFTHKFAHWVDQFGTLGCVGCGRCIAWCPVGIDVTEELARLNGEGATDDERTVTGGATA